MNLEVLIEMVHTIAPPTVEQLEGFKKLAKEKGIPLEDIANAIKEVHDNSEVYLNDVYQVNVRHEAVTIIHRDAAELVEETLGVIHLSIKRRDKEPIRDWRDLQEIKNQLLGPEYEAVELYPAESRRVDTANQYHLWTYSTPGYSFPFGFFPDEPRNWEGDYGTGSKQRKFNDEK